MSNANMRMMGPEKDPQIALTLTRRARIFAIVEAMKLAGITLNVEAIAARMQTDPEGFTHADYAWVRNMLGKRLAP